MGRLFFKPGLIIGLLSLMGCTTAQNSIFRSFDLDDGGSVATDASQRIIINTKTHPTSRPGRVNPERIVCAEPSPDVASIVANSFGFSLNVLGKGNAALAGGQGTALAQLAERTVTVQLLRDQMYRACEAYANGAISGTEYSLLMSRNNDAMVTLMLGESASRLVGRQLATLSASADSNASASMPGLLEAAENLIKETEEAADAQEELTLATETEGAATAAVQSTTQNSSDAATEEAQEEAEEAEDDVAEAAATANDESDEADEARESMAQAIAATKARSGATPGGFVGGVPTLNEHAVGVAEHLGRMQKEYLDQGAEEHMISACIVELGNTIRPLSIKSTDAKTGMSVFSTDDIKPRSKPEVLTEGRFSPDELSRSEKIDLLVGQGSNQSDLAVKTDDQIDELVKPMVDQEKMTEAGWAYDSYYRAERKEQRGISSFGRQKEIASERLRTFVALHQRENSSSLAQACAQWLPNILDNQGKTERHKLAFSLLTDLERIRARAKGKSPVSTDKPTAKEPTKKKSASDYVVKYVRCDEEKSDSKIEACRIGVIDALIKGTDVPALGGGGRDDEASKIDPKSGSHIIQLSSNKDKKALENEWKKIKKDYEALLKEKKEYYVESGSGTAKVYGLRIGPYASQENAKKFCTESKRSASNCQVTQLKK